MAFRHFREQVNSTALHGDDRDWTELYTVPSGREFLLFKERMRADIGGGSVSSGDGYPSVKYKVAGESEPFEVLALDAGKVDDGLLSDNVLIVTGKAHRTLTAGQKLLAWQENPSYSSGIIAEAMGVEFMAGNMPKPPVEDSSSSSEESSSSGGSSSSSGGGLIGYVPGKLSVNVKSVHSDGSALDKFAPDADGDYSYVAEDDPVNHLEQGSYIRGFADDTTGCISFKENYGDGSAWLVDFESVFGDITFYLMLSGGSVRNLEDITGEHAWSVVPVDDVSEGDTVVLDITYTPPEYI